MSASNVFVRALFKRLSTTASATVKPKICIVGAGPAGFYAAQHLIKNLPDVRIDIIERLPVPFGLVRFGVAPDHPEVKNVINTFTKTARHPYVRFIGNVNLGSNITLKQLRESYHAVLLTYGAEKDRELNIPGEGLRNVISARDIVGWYNGVPWNADLELDLSGSSAVIIGQGNVAVDVARMLLTPVDLLKATDITQHALETLMTSKIKKVYLVGRRGPLQAAFTIKELREMIKLPNCHTEWTEADFGDVPDVQTLPRPRKRITELMLSSLKTQPPSKGCKLFVPKFLRSPLKFSGQIDKVERVRLAVNVLDKNAKLAVATNEIEELNCDLVVRSIGYKSKIIDKNVPFDENRGVIRNQNGKVDDGLYVAGWLSTGPTGVILTTMSNAFETANLICNDLKQGISADKPGYDMVSRILEDSNTQIVTWNNWEKIDKYEQEMGKKVGKPREKIVCIDKMLDVAQRN